MPTARQIKAELRKQAEAEISKRADAVLGVVRRRERVDGLRSELAIAEAELADEIKAATGLMSMADLAQYANTTEAELRRAAKPVKPVKSAGAAKVSADSTTNATDAKARSDGARSPGKTAASRARTAAATGS